MSDTPKKSNHPRKGTGKRRLDDHEIFERMLRTELEELYNKQRGNKKKKLPPTPLTPEEARKLESLIRSRAKLDEIKAAQKMQEAEADVEAEAMTADQVRKAIADLKKQQSEE